MILTATGLVVIENIKAGDIVISTNPDTKETAEKRVVETYIREDSKLIHLVVNGEEIITTETHPFYVNKCGFVEAGELKVGDELLDVDNNILLIEDYTVEVTKQPTTVYNFQVEDFHTYFVGECYIWVHNATCTPENITSLKEHLEGTGAKDGAKTNGNINGTHNKNNFMSELRQNDGEIISSQPLQNIDGAKIIEYTGSNGRVHTKTVYDPSVISTEEFVNRSLSAVKNMPGELYDYSNGLYQFPDSQGVNWDIFVRNGEVITVDPLRN